MDTIYAFYNPHYPQVQFIGHESRLILFLLVLSLVRSIRIRLFFIFTLFTSSLIQYLYFQYFGDLIQPIAFSMLINNIHEVAESYFDVISTAIIPLLLVITAFFIAVRVNGWFQKKLFAPRFGVVVLLLFFSYQLVWTYSRFHQDTGRLDQKYALKIYPISIVHSAINFQRSFFYFLAGIVPQKIFGSTQNFPVLDSPQLKEPSPERTVVLIIGESLRYDRLSVLGYHRQTTPELDQLSAQKDIYADWVYTGGTMTKTAMSVVLNRLKYPGGTAQISTQKNNLFKLAKDNSFETYIFSAQKRSTLRVLDNLICKDCIDHYENRTTYRHKYKRRKKLENKLKNTHKNTHVSKYDDILLSLTDEIDWDKSAFIIFQQRGSHSPYAKQVPPDFKKFTDDYDNTVLFTDHILTSLLSKIRQKCKNDLYYMYVSDHGELLGENGKNGHGWFEKEVYRVPFIFYADKQNREIYTNLLPQVRSQFDISNLVTTLLGYRVKWDSPDDDLYINGTDLNALAGYLHLKMEGKKVLSQELIR
jgi:heptose-I-phosphate ethanolaminephosphotransferase